MPRSSRPREPKGVWFVSLARWSVRSVVRSVSPPFFRTAAETNHEPPRPASARFQRDARAEAVDAGKASREAGWGGASGRKGGGGAGDLVEGCHDWFERWRPRWRGEHVLAKRRCVEERAAHVTLFCAFVRRFLCVFSSFFCFIICRSRNCHEEDSTSRMFFTMRTRCTTCNAPDTNLPASDRPARPRKPWTATLLNVGISSLEEELMERDQYQPHQNTDPIQNTTCCWAWPSAPDPHLVPLPRLPPCTCLSLARLPIIP